jgi:fructose-1-phosphate kinase PfkB-like protein
MVFVPAPRLTVTIELRGGAPDIHLHPGGQGVWQARMLQAMDTPVVLCAVFGGETGQVARQLLADSDLITRGERPAVALVGDEVYEVVSPRLESVDSSGAGDSMTAAIVAGIARGEDVADAIRTGAAAGALNITRRGLGSGQREAIMELRGRVRLQPVRAPGASRGTWERSHLQATPEQLAERIRPR